MARLCAGSFGVSPCIESRKSLQEFLLEYSYTVIIKQRVANLPFEEGLRRDQVLWRTGLIKQRLICDKVGEELRGFCKAGYL